MPNPANVPYKINISLWNQHRDPMYGMTGYVHNWTTQEVIVEYAAVNLIDTSDDIWLRDDGRELIARLQNYTVFIQNRFNQSSCINLASRAMSVSYTHLTLPTIYSV